MIKQTRFRRSPGTLIWMIVILLLATALRLYHIDFSALWFDEGVSITFGHLPLRDVMHYTVLWEEVNPPLYRQMLGLWTDIVGTTAFTVRWFSGWAGILAIALTYRLGRKLGLGMEGSLVSALLMTLSPMQIYYGQEAKGYTFIQTCILFSIWLWLSLSCNEQPPKWRWLLLWITYALALGSHAAPWLMLGSMSLWIILWARGRWLSWSLIVGSLGVFWAAWFIPVAETVMRGAAGCAATSDMSPRSPLAYLGDMLREFAAGPIASEWESWTLSGIVFALAVLGLWRGHISRRNRWLLASWLIFPVLLGMGVQIAVPFFFARFLLYVVSALMLLVAAGLGSLPRRWMRLSGLGVMVLVMIFPLIAHYTRPSDPTTDYRPLAADLTEQIRPGDALIYSYSWQPGFLDAYLSDDAYPTYYLSFFPPDTIDDDLGNILERHGRVWLVTYQLGAEDPIHAAGQWLLENAAAPTSTWYGNGQLSLFLGQEATINPDPPSDIVSFDNGRITLAYAPAEARTAPGEPIGVTLTWVANESISERYIVFLHLLGEESPEPLAQHDGQPVNNMHPTYSWSPGESVRDYRALWLPTSLPQGEPLSLIVGLYDADTLERVSVDGGGDRVNIGTIVIDPTTPQW